ncbi:hypothetical protein QQZ08_007625 [Neonectria magnoliae]|uniref:Ribonuclease H1 N-terminal domain-containing protein n=1 Tax=Neonectria magnoliae TaxID=2732573 RepID=A0ABR1HZ91_9HYPO
MPNKFYAVAVGKEIGVFETWAQTEPLVIGFKGAKHQSFRTFEEALEFVELNKANSVKPPAMQRQPEFVSIQPTPSAAPDPPKSEPASGKRPGKRGGPANRGKWRRARPGERDRDQMNSLREGMRGLELDLKLTLA